MVIKANPTMQPPQAPSTPIVAQQALSELVNYYRELAEYHRSSVDYHRQLLEKHSQDAEVAEKQLASIEAILHPLRATPAPESNSDNISLTTGSVNQDINGKQVNGTKTITSFEDQTQNKLPEKGSNTLVVPEVTTVELEESKVEEITTDNKKSKTKASKSVIRSSSKKNNKTKSSQTSRTKVHGRNRRKAQELPSNQKDAEQDSISSEATKTKKPTKSKNTRKIKKPTKTFSPRLPYSEKLAARETIVDAVAFCLQEYYPQTINAEYIVDYYYPEGLEGETKKRAYGAFSNCLSKGAGKQGWVRSSIGKYRWKEGS